MAQIRLVCCQICKHWWRRLVTKSGVAETGVVRRPVARWRSVLLQLRHRPCTKARERKHSISFVSEYGWTTNLSRLNYCDVYYMSTTKNTIATIIVDRDNNKFDAMSTLRQQYSYNNYSKRIPVSTSYLYTLSRTLAKLLHPHLHHWHHRSLHGRS